MKYLRKVALRRYIIHVSRGAFSLNHKSQKLTSLGSSSSRHNGDPDAVTMSSWRPRPTPLNWNPVSYSYSPSFSSSSSSSFSLFHPRLLFPSSSVLRSSFVVDNAPALKFWFHVNSANSVEFERSTENLERCHRRFSCLDSINGCAMPFPLR